MRMIFIVSVLILSLCASSYAADLEYSGYYMQRKGQVRKNEVSKKMASPKRTGKNPSSSTLKGHTLERNPSCVMYFGVGAEFDGTYWRALVKEKEKVSRKIVHGVRPAAGDKEGTKFLHDIIAGNYVKICQPQLNPMPDEKIYGLFYVEPLLDSLQEMLLDRGFARLFNSTVEN